MEWTIEDQKNWNHLKKWEESLYEYEKNDFERIYETVIQQVIERVPPHIKQELFSKMDTWMFYLHSYIQGSQYQQDAKARIIQAAKIFDSSVENIEDLQRLPIHQLQYIRDQQVSRLRLYSLVQGSVTGTGDVLALLSDVPAMMIINLRAIQLTAMCYGVNPQSPFDMSASLQVFHAGTLSKRHCGSAWKELVEEAEKVDHPYLYDGPEVIADETWFEKPIRQIMKSYGIFLFRHQQVSGAPLLSMMIGATSNYQFTRNVTDFAKHYYEFRYLLQKKKALLPDAVPKP